jgi:hypothetical protein
MLVGRPVAVALCLRPLGYGWGEIGFAGWVGLRGAVPIYLAIIPVLSGVPVRRSHVRRRLRHRPAVAGRSGLDHRPPPACSASGDDASVAGPAADRHRLPARRPTA